MTTPRDLATTYDQGSFAVAHTDLVASTTTAYEAAGNVVQTTDGNGCHSGSPTSCFRPRAEELGADPEPSFP